MNPNPNTTSSLEIIDFKNRIWLLFVSIPGVFILFVGTFIIFALVFGMHSAWKLYTCFFIFLIEKKLLFAYITRRRFKTSGVIKLNESEIYTENAKENVIYKWDEIQEITFYYCGDFFWNRWWSKLNFDSKNSRYQNLRWSFNSSEVTYLDRLCINNKTFYVKIRNQHEKNLFFEFIKMAEKHNCQTKLIQPEFNKYIFGQLSK